MEGLKRKPTLAGAKQVPIEAAAILLAGAVGAGDSARPTVELVGARHDAPGKIGLTTLVEDARPVEVPTPAEVIEQPEVILEVQGDSPILPTGVDGGQLEVELINRATWSEGAGDGDRCAVGESYDRVFRVFTWIVDGFGPGRESAAAQPPGRFIVDLHVGVAEPEGTVRLPPEIAGPGHRGALAKHAGAGPLDAVPDPSPVGEKAVGEGAVCFDAGRVAGPEEGVGHASVNALHPTVGDDPLAGAGHEGGAAGDRKVVGKLPADHAQRHDRVVFAVVSGAEECQRPDQPFVGDVAVGREHEPVDVERVDVADRRILSGRVGPAGAAAGELKPPNLHEPLDGSREGETSGLLGVVELQALWGGDVGSRCVGSLAGEGELPLHLGLNEFLKIGRIEEWGRCRRLRNRLGRQGHCDLFRRWEEHPGLIDRWSQPELTAVGVASGSPGR